MATRSGSWGRIRGVCAACAGLASLAFAQSAGAASGPSAGDGIQANAYGSGSVGVYTVGSGAPQGSSAGGVAVTAIGGPIRLGGQGIPAQPAGNSYTPPSYTPPSYTPHSYTPPPATHGFGAPMPHGHH